MIPVEVITSVHERIAIAQNSVAKGVITPSSFNELIAQIYAEYSDDIPDVLRDYLESLDGKGNKFCKIDRVNSPEEK